MSDLISREALIANIREHRGTAEADGHPFNIMYCLGLDNAISRIEEQPNIDAAPVVHAEWVPFCDGWFSYFVCSKCGEKTFSTCMGKPRFNYCPMCGAKMDEGVDEA